MTPVGQYTLGIIGGYTIQCIGDYQNPEAGFFNHCSPGLVQPAHDLCQLYLDNHLLSCSHYGHSLSTDAIFGIRGMVSDTTVDNLRPL